MSDAEDANERDTGRRGLRVALRGNGLTGRSTWTKSPSSSSSSSVASFFPSFTLVSSLSDSQSVERFLLLFCSPDDSFVDLPLYFGRLDGAGALGCKVEEKPRNTKEAEDLDDFSLNLPIGSLVFGGEPLLPDKEGAGGRFVSLEFGLGVLVAEML